MSILSTMSFTNIKVLGHHNGGHITNALLRMTDLETIIVTAVNCATEVTASGHEIQITTAVVLATGQLPDNIFVDGFLRI